MFDKKSLSETDIRTKYITPAIVKAGWDSITQMREEYNVTKGRIIARGKSCKREAPLKADYVLFYKPNKPIAIIEAKDNKHTMSDGMQQALQYASMMNVPFVFSSNGDGFVFHNKFITEGDVEVTLSLDEFPSPETLWKMYLEKNNVSPAQEKIIDEPYYSDNPDKQPRYYQMNAINKTVEAISGGQDRVLLVMATGTGKTYTALKEHQQALISTHSEEIIKGLLEVCPERIKIVRITREEDTNKFSILNNAEFKQVWNDPLLKYSNIMASLFHKSVVLCESDSDCKMYSIIESHIKQKQQKYSETLFIHCGGKHRMARIITALRSLDIEVKLIADIDVLNDETVFKGIVESFGIDYATIQADYNNIVSNLHSPKEKVNRNSAKATINQILDGSKATDLSKREIGEIEEVVSTISKWKAIKTSGSSAIPAGNATASFRKIDQLLKDNGVFVVSVGELECFIKEVGGHGPDWANDVLEKYPDLDDAVYKSITEFVSAMNL